MRDTDFLSGKFIDLEIPKEKRFLLRYFKTKLQQAFLRYYLVFGEVWNFTDHTGYYCNRRLAFRMAENYKRLISTYERSKRALTEEGMETIHLLESRKLPLTRLPKS